MSKSNVSWLLFASRPDSSERLDGRGVPLLLDVAQRCPEIKFRLLWRPWGDSLSIVNDWRSQRELANIEVAVGCVEDIADEYQASHAAIAPFTKPELCKPAPNSLIESQSSGRPVICTNQVGIAELEQFTQNRPRNVQRHFGFR